MAQEAMGLMLEDYKVYPKPSSPKNVQTEPGDFVVMIQFDEESYKKQFKPVKKTLSIPAWLNDASRGSACELFRGAPGSIKGQIEYWLSFIRSRPCLCAGGSFCEVSIHALRAEGDAVNLRSLTAGTLFLSTPSVWRAT